MSTAIDPSVASGGHGGNIHLLTRNSASRNAIIDFSANINPLGPPPWLRNVISRAVSDVVHYPDPECYEFIQAVAARYTVAPQTIVAANGTTELLYQLPRMLKCRRAVVPVPSYIDYRKVMDLEGIEVVEFPLLPNNNFTLDCNALEEVLEDDDVVILGSPNNPTGTLIDSSKLSALAATLPHTTFVVDEAFLDFALEGQSVAGTAENIITLHSLTKFYAIPGIRLGFGIFPDLLADALKKILPPWSVNTIAQTVGSRLLSDHVYFDKTRSTVNTLRRQLFKELRCMDALEVFPSSANYHLVRITTALKADELCNKLLQRNVVPNIAIRVCSNYSGLDNSYFRVAVRDKEDNEKLIEALNAVFVHSKRPRVAPGHHHKSLMVQGTSSNAGKSVIVAALCRILVQDGYRVAPFKAQNMSLNSFVTHDGMEMGRAQVVQAQAAKLAPDVRMNPILLKPNSDVGSQVIVHGSPVGNMSVYEYLKYKTKAAAQAHQSYDSLAADFDVVLLEGAGSPGEVNLKNHDIVNMRMAQYAKSPVLLVGDIDRGGVYASFAGTMEVMEEWERKLIGGFLVNRFRGDESLLHSAHEYIYNLTGKPVLGTIPNINDLGIPEEDSVSFKAGKLQKKRPSGDHVEIALINLPHISNFTDIEPFVDEPDVYLKIVSSPSELGNPDSIILPGSKNVVGDLGFLQQTGLDDAIVEKAVNGIETVGICGGYQMLGHTIHDPYRIESDAKNVSALGLLPIDTTLARHKTLTRKAGKHLPTGLDVHGYEIHHGLSNGVTQPLLKFDDKTNCGTCHDNLAIWGAYLHGIFDADIFRRSFIDKLRKRKGLEGTGRIAAPYNLERAFDTLADVVRKSIDMDTVYSLIHK